MNYTAQLFSTDGEQVIRLADTANQTEVLIAPGVGNMAYSMQARGQEVFWSPGVSVAELKRKEVFCACPFLGPWANRIDPDAYYANGNRYRLNPDLGNLLRDPAGLTLHGLLHHAAWQVTAVDADAGQAAVTSRIEFWRYPDWMAQFPFAHNVEMSYRLREGALTVETRIENLSLEPMPLSVGFHPYFQIPGVPRDDWRIHIAARGHVALSGKLTPTGEVKPVALADPLPLGGVQLDDVFTDLVRGPDGSAVFWLEGGSRRISVEYGANYPVAVVYAPPGKDYVCFEPMAGVTNVFNLAHEGKFPLQLAPPQGSWSESFVIRPGGF